MPDFPALINKLQDENPNNRYDACEQLQIALLIPKEALEALRKTIKDPNADVADAARRAVALHTSPSPFPISAKLPDAPEILAIPKVGFWRRWLAYIADLVFLGSVDESLVRVFGDLYATGGWDVALDIILTSIPVIYFIWAYSTSGQTLGKKLCKIKVVCMDGSPLNWRKGFLRTIGYGISAFPLWLGFAWAIWDKDKTAWHDKISGTRVVPLSVTNEQLQGTVDLEEAIHNQRVWLLGTVFSELIILVIGGVIIISVISGISQQYHSEMDDLGAWPGPEVSPQELVSMDLSHLDLTMGQIQNARNDREWSSPSWQYKEGVRIDYHSDNDIVVSVWALKYENQKVAVTDWEGAINWYSENCDNNSYTAEILHCTYSDGFDELIRNDIWIVNLVVIQSIEFNPEALASKVRDALAAHWDLLNQN